MKKLSVLVLLVLAVALLGCGRETEQIDSDMTNPGDDTRTLTLAWHKVSEDDGSICELSAATQRMVEQAREELSRILAPANVKVAVETLTPEKVDGAECLCNRILVQGRFVDEWLGAEMVKTGCSGCPNQAGCPNGAGSDGCGGQYAMVHQGRTYSIVPANLITMAGMIAAADLTGETIGYAASSVGIGGNCPCGRCRDGCKGGDCGQDCIHHVAGAPANEPAPAAERSGCPRAASCRNAGCPSKSSGS
jgi:hypothetical protein